MAKVLVFFGGTDAGNTTGTVLAALSGPELDRLELDIVVGANNPHRESLEQQAERRGRARVIGPLPHLADLISAADLAIGAGGTTTWERMCLGLPAIVVCIAENQRASAEALGVAKLVDYAGTAADLQPADLRSRIQDAIRDPMRLGGMALRNQLLVDGLGTARVTEALCPTDPDKLALRPARAEDAALYYGWVNEAAVRSGAFNSAPIAWEDHADWFARRQRDPQSRLLVLEAAGLPVGQVRFDREGDWARIDYSLDALVRGRGWGRRLLALGIRHMQRTGVTRFAAEVKRANRASCAVFPALGFEEMSVAPEREIRAFQLELDQSTLAVEALR